jgi:hypothetical protein
METEKPARGIGFSPYHFSIRNGLDRPSEDRNWVVGDPDRRFLPASLASEAGRDAGPAPLSHNDRADI